LWKEQPTRSFSQRLGQELDIFAVLPKEKSDLEERIENRFMRMLDRGLLQELTVLRRNYRLDLSCPSMRTVGYRQAWSHLEGTIDRLEFVDEAIRATKLLAKKQMTWLRAWDHLETLYIGEDLKLWEKVSEKSAVI
jgi:tRNA dimethylallyltransferase